MKSYQLTKVRLETGEMKWSFSVDRNKPTLDSDYIKAIQKSYHNCSKKTAKWISIKCGYEFD
jgi:hypothetical protein